MNYSRSVEHLNYDVVRSKKFDPAAELFLAKLVRCKVALLGVGGLPSLTRDDLPPPETQTWYFLRDDLVCFSVRLLTKSGFTFLVYDFTAGHLAETFVEVDKNNILISLNGVPPGGPPFPMRAYVQSNADVASANALPPCRFILKVQDGWSMPQQWTAEQALDWSTPGWTICVPLRAASQAFVVQNSALFDSSVYGVASTADEIGTSMAIPFGVSLAPDEVTLFQHAAEQRTFNGWTEAWSTELLPGGDVLRGQALGLRAVLSAHDAQPQSWEPSTQYFKDALIGDPTNRIQRCIVPGISGNNSPSWDEFRGNKTNDGSVVWQTLGANSPIYGHLFEGQLLSARLRADLVKLTSQKVVGNIRPTSLQTDHLIYSPGGTSLATRGEFAKPGDPTLPRAGEVSLLRWSYTASAGRDEVGHSAAFGHIYPFGQRVIITTEARRVIRFGQAVLDLVQSISLLDRQVSYKPENFRQPLLYTKILNTSFPEVSQDASSGLVSALGDGSEAPLILHFEAKDCAGNLLHFQTQCRIVPETFAGTLPLEFHQQEICYAFPPKGPEVLLTSQLVISANWTISTFDANGLPAGQLFQVGGATVNLPAVDHFMPVPPSQPVFRPITFLPQAQPDGVFASIITSERTGGSTDRYGAFAGAKLNLTHISVDHGAISRALSNVPAPGVKLPGFDGFNVFGFNLGTAITSMPPAPPEIKTTRNGTSITTTLTATMSDLTIQASPFIFSAGTAQIDVASTVAIDASAPVTDPGHSNCTLQNVSLRFDNYIEFKFIKVSFLAVNGQKAAVAAQYESFSFLGQLAFVNEIFKYIPKDSFSNPPDIQINSSAAHLGYTQAVPTIAFGAFSFSNLSLGAAMDLTFTGATGGAPSSTFNLSTAQAPFTVSVGIFGGGGYLAVTLSPKSFQLAASIDFGGVFQFNAYIASGAVSLTAGLLLIYDSVNKLTVGGNVHLSGAVQVLGLVSFSLDVCLTLTYSESDGVFTGSAEVSVRVDVAFFHKSVSFTASRSFSASGSPAPPDASQILIPQGKPLGQSILPGTSPRQPQFFLKQAMPMDQWNIYLNAFEAWTT